MAKKIPTQVRIRPQTRRDIDRLCKQRGWTIAEAIEQLVKSYQASQQSGRPNRGAA